MVCAHILSVILLLLGFVKKWIFEIRQRLFARYMTYAAVKYNLALKERKIAHLASLKDIVSADPELKDKNQIRILEIGAGSGTNFKFYPDGSQLIMLDINDKFEEKLIKNVREFPQLHLEQYVVADAADMPEVADSSVDVVISQYCLCSCNDVPRVLQEVRRVLMPGGKFYFLEHVLDKPGTWRRLVQKFLVYIGFWSFVSCGCSIAKETGTFIRDAGFSDLTLDHFYLDTKIHFVFHFTRPTIIGIATK
ncbi:hypothetical protein B566_EDAN008878 [Ephemera danica]|nr:hypothetical protein B566_EDAN008878 [Ephemera danica]